jgi:hypothetical protein
MVGDTVKRVLWTFVEAFLGTMAVLIYAYLTTENASWYRGLPIAAVIAGASAGFSVLKNLVVMGRAR